MTNRKNGGKTKAKSGKPKLYAVSIQCRVTRTTYDFLNQPGINKAGFVTDLLERNPMIIAYGEQQIQELKSSG